MSALLKASRTHSACSISDHTRFSPGNIVPNDSFQYLHHNIGCWCWSATRCGFQSRSIRLKTGEQEKNRTGHWRFWSVRPIKRKHICVNPTVCIVKLPRKLLDQNWTQTKRFTGFPDGRATLIFNAHLCAIVPCLVITCQYNVLYKQFVNKVIVLSTLIAWIARSCVTIVISFSETVWYRGSKRLKCLSAMYDS